MYKVFIDHLPVIFLEEGDLISEAPKLKFKDVEFSLKFLRKKMKGVSLELPLQIVCDDAKASFKEFFADFKKIDAAGGLVRRKEKFLLIKRKGLWDIPKGKIDKGESKEEAAVREIEEECGINGPKIESKLVTTYHTMKFRGRPALKKTYWYMMKYKGSKDTAPQLNEGITKAKWMPEDYMLAIYGRTYGSINHVLEAYCEAYGVNLSAK